MYFSLLQVTDEEPSKEQLRLLHATIKKVTTVRQVVSFLTTALLTRSLLAALHAWATSPALAADCSLLLRLSWADALSWQMMQQPVCTAVVPQVTTETEELRFNTGIASMMEFINGVYKNWGDSRWVELTHFRVSVQGCL